MTQKLEYTVLELIESATRLMKAQPLNLGGIAGVGGGVGAPPGGFIGYLPQTRVAYDEDELASSGVPASGMSLLDNLNHIRYRLNTIESGILVVDEIDGSPSVSDVNRLSFSGAIIVSEISPGHALVTITASGGGGISDAPSDTNIYGRKDAGWVDLDLTYLRLDASNDPITQQLVIENSSHFPELLKVISNNGKGVYIEAEAEPLAIFHIANGGNVAVPTITVYRYGNTFSEEYSRAIIEIEDYNDAAGYTGGTIKHTDPNSDVKVDINPYASANSIMVLFDSVNDISTTGRLLSLKNQTVEKFSVDGDGNVNIPSGQFYRVANTNVVGNRIIDSRISGTINSGDSTTDGVIDAIRDALIAHGLIAAS